MGPAQPLPGFVATLVLQDMLARILNFMKGMYQKGTLPSALTGPRVRDEVQILVEAATQGVQVPGV